MISFRSFLLGSFFPLALNAQHKDTVYFDYNWSLCEMPVSVYYRIAAINTDKLVFYTGDVTDYYKSGQIEMVGHYNEKGEKDGTFKSFYADGIQKQELNYHDDSIRGICSFYDSSGFLQMRLDCLDESRFSPIFLINEKKDTLVKNGTGHFVINKTTFPDLFTVASPCTIEGQVSNGKKEGRIVFSCGSEAEYTENYRNGKFESGEFADGHSTKYYRPVMTLYSAKLKRIDRFYHSNPIFGDGPDGDIKALNFLLNKTITGIPVAAKKTDDNYMAVFDVFSYVAKGVLSSRQVATSNNSGNDRRLIKIINTIPSEDRQPKQLRALVTLTIDTSGYISNSVVKGNLDIEQVTQLNYYLSNMYGFVPFTENGKEIVQDINIKLYSFCDTARKNDTIQGVRYMYIVENADKKDISPLPVFPDIEAKFPGGAEAWKRFIEKNISHFAVYGNAHKGIYMVMLKFTVDEVGNVSDVKVILDPGYGTAEAALRIFEHCPNWVPAVRNGRNIRSECYQTIQFNVQEEDLNPLWKRQ